MIFHLLTFARSRGKCLEPRAKPEISTFPRDLTNVNECKNHVLSLYYNCRWSSDFAFLSGIRLYISTGSLPFLLLHKNEFFIYDCLQKTSKLFYLGADSLYA